MKTQKNDIPAGLAVFATLVLFGAIASIADGVAYFLHVRAQGIGFFSSVPWSVLWTYLTTFPGSVLTGFWLLPWTAALAWLYVGYRDDWHRDSPAVTTPPADGPGSDRP